MELFNFSTISIGLTAVNANYTSNASNLIVDGVTYLAKMIQRKEISQDFDKNELMITMDANTWPASEFKLVNPIGVIEITIRNIDNVIIFVGRVTSCAFDMTKRTAELTAKSVQVVFKSEIPTRTYSGSCSYELYGDKCAVNAVTYQLQVPTAEVAVDGFTLTHSDFGLKPDGYYAAGWVETEYERGMVLKHEGTVLTLLFPINIALTVLETISVYPGCDKTLNTCDTVFDNVPHFGGFPFVPPVNPVEEEF